MPSVGVVRSMAGATAGVQRSMPVGSGGGGDRLESGRYESGSRRAEMVSYGSGAGVLVVLLTSR